MNYLSINEMENCSCSGEGWDCTASVLLWFGSIASLATGPAGWMIAAGLISYTVSGVNLAVQCAEWLRTFQE